MLGAAPAAAVLVSGFRPRDSRLAVRLAAGPWQASPIRTLHVIGRRDPIVAPAESLALRELLQGAGPGRAVLPLRRQRQQTVGERASAPPDAQRLGKMFAAARGRGEMY
ncbi:unnamed protein product, partial [Prorocentrum cordatum]